MDGGYIHYKMVLTTTAIFPQEETLGSSYYVAPEERLVIVRHGYDFGNVNWINLFENIATTA